jgi:predicted ATPase
VLPLQAMYTVPKVEINRPELAMTSSAKAIAEIVDVLRKFQPGGALKRYITHARFPRFKNLEPGSRIDFTFPITALVGANGIGKSSVLHALWGMPQGKSTSKFWFSTDLDPIVGSNKNPQRYIYGHWNESYGGMVETRKARVGKKTDYWEPSKATKIDGMEPVPAEEFEGKSKDRWNPVERDVVYINMKTTFGSFDRYFYFDEGLKESEKREVMVREARRLKSIIKRDLKTYRLGGRERVFENRLLDEDELKAVSKILGRKYKSARWVTHSLYPGYRGRDVSILFERKTEYSEAFAGSGELAAVHAVVEILKAPKYSLILLDEPETSLHPGAQRALLHFLMEQVKLKKHQVIISTHSFEFIQGLPNDAIKVFESNGKHQTRVLAECSPYIALHRLGRPPANKTRVLVEDALAMLLVKHAAAGLDPGEAKAIQAKIAPGGAESILVYHGPTAMAAGDTVYALLDGDKKKVDAFTNPDDIPPAKYPELTELLKVELGCQPKFLLAGGDDEKGAEQAEISAQLSYFRWLRQRLRYLPKLCPEKILLDAMDPVASNSVTTALDAKEALRAALAPNLKLSGSEMTTLEKVAVSKLPQDNVDIVEIRDILRAWVRTGTG